jgi:glycosyltransferase involved in cell wall biosynthesis
VKLSLVMPIYNEGRTLKTVLTTLGIVDMPMPWELIVVDDGSTDGAAYEIDPTWLPGAERVRVVRSDRNRGKGAAVRKGFSLAEGDVLGVQDADREYDPRQIPTLIEPILEGTADVVFGTREFGTQTAYSYWHVVGNKLLSVAASALFNRYVTDVYTCYKFFTRDRYDQLHLTATGFEIEAELVGGLLRSGARVMEVPIKYQARSREEGKKIRARDGVVGLGRMIRIRLRGW